MSLKIQKQMYEKMEDVCFGSLAYCCNRYCPQRNKALKKLGLSLGEYHYLKGQFDLNLLKLIENKYKGKDKKCLKE